MSAVEEDDTIKVLCCASCGIAGVDDITLRDCSACHLVKYCGVKCQKEHRSKHKKECKKRAAELRDELLFKQPESSHHGDCPICCLPLPLDNRKSGLYSCCSKQICIGCHYANNKRERAERLQHKCAFCREPFPKEEEKNELRMKRIAVNDPVAISHMGTIKSNEGDYKAAFEYWARAAKLGNLEAHYSLALMYARGDGLEKNQKKVLHHLEEAAIGGNPSARHSLGFIEEQCGRMDRAAKHFIIAAKLGHDKSLKCVKDLYQAGYVSKDDFAATLRGYQAAISATMSSQREEGYEFFGI